MDSRVTAILDGYAERLGRTMFMAHDDFTTAYYYWQIADGLPESKWTGAAQGIVDEQIVIAYCRPFTQTRGFEVLRPDHFATFDAPELLALHRRLRLLRNKVVAHNDSDMKVVEFDTDRPEADGGRSISSAWWTMPDGGQATGHLTKLGLSDIDDDMFRFLVASLMEETESAYKLLHSRNRQA